MLQNIRVTAFTVSRLLTPPPSTQMRVNQTPKLVNKKYYTQAQPVIFFSLCRFSFTTIHKSQDCRGMGGHFFNSSLQIPLASQTPGNYCRQLISAHSLQYVLMHVFFFSHATITFGRYQLKAKP